MFVIDLKLDYNEWQRMGDEMECLINTGMLVGEDYNIILEMVRNDYRDYVELASRSLANIKCEGYNESK